MCTGYVFCGTLVEHNYFLHIFLHFTDEIIQDHSNKSSNMSPYPLSMQPHTTTPIPQQLTIKGPCDHFKTVKVVPDADKTPENDDQWYTLSVSILDSSSSMPLNCAVVLKGDKLAPGKGTIVCYLTFNVKYKGSQASADPPTVPTHYIERRSEYTPNGRATFRMCFYTMGSYLISVGVACIQDEKGLECAGYNVDKYTTVIRAVRMVERGAFKRPPLLEFHGPLASKRFRKLMTLYRELHYKGKHDETQRIRSRLLSSDRVELDIRLYISALNVTDSSHNIEQGEELLKKCQTLDCQNGSLLQAYCLMSLATLYYDNGDKEKASEYIRYARSECYGAAPSYLTSLVFYCEARNLLRQHKGNVTPFVKRKAMELFNCAINSYCGVGWEKYVLCLCHIKMAMFCLSESTGYEFCPSSNYTPSDEDISLAEEHLKAVPDDELHEMSWYAISYHIAQSDLNRLRGDTASAREHVKMAEKVLHDLKTAPKYTNKFGTPIRSRIQYLEADPIDKILEEYNYK